VLRYAVLALASLVAVLAALARAAPNREQPPSAALHLVVTEAGSGKALPCRIVLRGTRGEPVMVRAAETRDVAVRPGVVYTGSGDVTLSVPPGRLTLYALRGPTYSLARKSVTLKPGGSLTVRLELRREVGTSGYVSCDPHTHTLTYGGHGDATIQERVVTLAGEGIEMPVATEHNKHVSYSQAAEQAGVSRWFTPVVGDEVTTSVGHWCLFPLRPKDTPAPVTPLNRASLLAASRAMPEARVAILNHPADVHASFRPADPARFHLGSGESLDGQTWGFDAIEVINSSAQRSDFMEPFRVWFALLNRGYHTVAVGASDCHDVDAFIVSQARTYIRGSAAAPDRVDVADACTNLLAGRALVSLGLLTEAWVDHRFGVGDLATGLGSTLPVRVRVQGPGWMSADRVELWMNGRKVAERRLSGSQTRPVKADLTFRLPKPKQDAWLVAIASGPADNLTFWPIAPPYQPSRLDWEPRVIGATNPIRIDGDGDGRYSSPFDYAKAALESSGGSAAKLMSELAHFDEAVSVQAASLLRERGVKTTTSEFQQALQSAPQPVRTGFALYEELLPQSIPR
jgi:hypothetical protein